MRWTAAIPFIAILASRAFASDPVTVDRLRSSLAEQQAARKTDADIARGLAGIQLAERLTDATLSEIVDQAKPGPKTLSALTLIADRSAFLDPPVNELPSMDAPTAAAQRSMIGAALKYVAGAMQRLPDFLATRETRSFDNNPLIPVASAQPRLSNDLRSDGVFRQEITYRDGHEDLIGANGNAKPHNAPPGLSSWGEFGPLPAIVLADSARGELKWKRWERAASGPLAVFEFKVPRNASHYAVNYCCVRQVDGPDPDHPYMTKDEIANSYRGTPGYHGTISVEPETGAILRLTLQSELRESDPITISEIAVQYGNVEIGDKSYICPVKSIAISSVLVGSETSSNVWTVLRLNDVLFTGYHRFGSTVKILPGFAEQ
jgi:hypothetical protein